MPTARYAAAVLDQMRSLDGVNLRMDLAKLDEKAVTMLDALAGNPADAELRAQVVALLARAFREPGGDSLPPRDGNLNLFADAQKDWVMAQVVGQDLADRLKRRVILYRGPSFAPLTLCYSF
jgi:hypothetical protein